MKQIVVAWLAVLLSSLNAQSIFAGDLVFSADEHCLAYRTAKKMFFFADVEVIGKSCEIATHLMWSESGNRTRVEVSVPVRSLDSDNSLRDDSVIEILKADRYPEIRFVSVWFGVNKLREILFSGRGDVSGTLEVGGRSFPVEFTVKFTHQPGYILVEAGLITTFSAFELEVPTVGPGGLLADVSDDLELLAHLRSDRIEGAEKISGFGN